MKIPALVWSLTSRTNWDICWAIPSNSKLFNDRIIIGLDTTILKHETQELAGEANVEPLTSAAKACLKRMFHLTKCDHTWAADFVDTLQPYKRSFATLILVDRNTIK